ncbi:hypothetical protein ACBJ59_53730 [Nonomuraea sp. MTCD27]|uniref:hypothetical protein n=1 Tax=Nonomuraea sp. MTCD27 TaxID=1676747 RepID=UPI0035C0A2D9
MDRRMAGLAAGMVAVLVLGGSGALAAAPQRNLDGDPCSGTATCSPTDLAKAKEAAAAKADDPGKGGSGCSPEGERPGTLESENLSQRLAQALADALGVGLDRASAAVHGLNALSQNGGIRPDSPEFAAVAERLGVSAERLQEVLKGFKRANEPQGAKPGPGKTPDS